MRLAARFLKGRKVASHVRCIIIPGSEGMESMPERRTVRHFHRSRSGD